MIWGTEQLTCSFHRGTKLSQTQSNPVKVKNWLIAAVVVAGWTWQKRCLAFDFNGLGGSAVKSPWGRSQDWSNIVKVHFSEEEDENEDEEDCPETLNYETNPIFLQKTQWKCISVQKNEPNLKPFKPNFRMLKAEWWRKITPHFGIPLKAGLEAGAPSRKGKSNRIQPNPTF